MDRDEPIFSSDSSLRRSLSYRQASSSALGGLGHPIFKEKCHRLVSNWLLPHFIPNQLNHGPCSNSLPFDPKMLGGNGWKPTPRGRMHQCFPANVGRQGKSPVYVQLFGFVLTARNCTNTFTCISCNLLLDSLLYDQPKESCDHEHCWFGATSSPMLPRRQE